MKRSFFLILVVSLTMSACAGNPVPTDIRTAPATSAMLPTETPSDAGSDESPEAIDRQFQLPEGYLAEKLFIPPLAGVLYIARSQSGVVYVSHYIQNAGISIIDPFEKRATRILDLPSQAGKSLIVGGPGDSALIGVNEEIWQVYPDGSHTVWGRRGGRPQYFTFDGRLLGTTHDGTAVVELLPDGSIREIAAGFSKIFNLVASTDGRIYVSDWDTGNITRIDTDTSQHILVQKLVVNDPIDLGLDDEGNLYFNSASTETMGGFVKMDTATGQFTHHNLYSQMCTEHLTDFVFIAPGKLIFVDPTMSQVTWEDLSTRTGGLLVSNQGANTHAADIGPDDALYSGTRGCGEDLPAQVLRLGDDGTRTVYVDGLEGDIRDIVFDPNGGLYIAASIPRKGGALFYVPSPGSDPVLIPGATDYSILSIAYERNSGHLLLTQFGSDTISEFSLRGLVVEHPIRLPKKAGNFILATSQDGPLYAFISEWERRDVGPVVDRWLLSIDLNKGTSTIVFAHEQKGCCVMGNLNVDQQGTLWWIPGREFQIYKVEPNGTALLFAQNLPIDSASISIDNQGNVYITSSGGIYRIYKK